MNTAILAIGLALLIAIGAAAYVHTAQRKQRKADADANRITAVVTEYFARSGAQVAAQCHPVAGRFLVLVESEPLKRFRFSHIIEASLMGHIEKADLGESATPPPSGDPKSDPERLPSSASDNLG